MSKVTIVFDSLTGNTERFVKRIGESRPEWDYIKIKSGLKVDRPFHLITYTTGLGEVPESTTQFVLDNLDNLVTVSASGNRNWGQNYALAANKISQQYNKPILEKFEVADWQEAIDDMIKKIEGRLYEK